MVLIYYSDLILIICLHKVIWFPVIQSNRNNLQAMIWFQLINNSAGNFNSTILINGICTTRHLS